jgi:hypothetical protein
MHEGKEDSNLWRMCLALMEVASTLPLKNGWEGLCSQFLREVTGWDSISIFSGGLF